MKQETVKPKALFTVKHRSTSKLAVVVAYNEVSGRKGRVLASEPIQNKFSIDDVTAAAKRLVPQVSSHFEVILPIGIEI